ncbi:hypothetical protein RND81_09G060500 [Saponaria officinalis]|uniref:Zinc finger CCCH domain-containing protein 18-like n=1 Tax=Saponaria officinalis TaxID=3572 RepID=A0AAW1IIJ9_SAPOF
MDLLDATKILLDRIQKLEPEIATKIMGCILMQDHGEREMIRLAYAPEMLLENLVQKTKLQLGFLAKPQLSTSLSSSISVNSPPVSEVPLNYMSFSPNGSRSYSSPYTFGASPTPYWDHLCTLTSDQQEILNSEFLSFGDSGVAGFEDPLETVSIGTGCFPRDVLNMRKNQYLPNLSEFPVKTCHYFNRGFCKHGNACRYLHGQDNVSTLISSHELRADDHLFSRSSLEKLDVEISELLKSKRGPVSIASLPHMYGEKYGRSLRAEGYLTESQRNGRAGYSLTKLLERLKTIRVIDRPHGQHSVILAEDASKHDVEHRSERNDPGSVASGSRQIYMTFPAESTFTEEDVSDYFGQYGNVEDVRIPCQEKRMFGFVTFSSANTVKTILAEGSPHSIRGARVLVKPYREKSKLVERKNMDKNEHVPRCEAPRFWRRQLMEQQALEMERQALEMERRHLSELLFGRKYIHDRQFLGYGMEELTSVEDASNFATAEQYHYLMNAINNGFVVDERSRHLDTHYTEQESQGINLPDSPFASANGSSISAVI